MRHDKYEFTMTFKTEAASDRTYRVNVVMDYSGCTREEIIEWASAGSSRRVVLQTALRKKPAKYLEALERTGLRVHAKDCGTLITPEERAAKDKEAAERAIANMGADELEALEAKIAELKAKKA